MHHLLEVWFGWVLHGGYWGIIGLMAMESSIIPIPAEVVIPPAAFLAARGDLNMAGVGHRRNRRLRISARRLGIGSVS